MAGAVGLNRIILPQATKKQVVWAGMCVHRGVKAKVFNMMRILEKCPDPHFEFKLIEGDALIARSRSRMATDFLNKSEAEVLLFLDDDILYDPMELRNMMKAMQHHDLDILGASYMTKEERDPCFCIRPLEPEEVVYGEGGSIQEVMYVSTGCMAVHRRVFQKMIDAEIVHLCHPKTLKYYPFFANKERYVQGMWMDLSEDWEFCHRARDLGFKVWNDTTVKLGHIGDKIYDWDDFHRRKKEEDIQKSVLYRVGFE